MHIYREIVTPIDVYIKDKSLHSPNRKMKHIGLSNTVACFCVVVALKSPEV